MNLSSRDLPVPTAVATDGNARELLRLWTTEGSGETVTLRVDGLEPMAWGLMLVDIAKHAAHAYARQGTHSANDAFAGILSGFIAEIGEATDDPAPIDG